ncbi:integrin beta-1-binding protein 1 isoform X2 [Pristis pectinata]|uniref:integrin beta-1-binding protein 1 isoform X2 n=1 Tax=Pristis pectinata TaxID=685728 RepID=UPI00223D99A2|nr:integrin beta-1-binding protein 1 isoform X2 [Pristis pectinata]
MASEPSRDRDVLHLDDEKCFGRERNATVVAVLKAVKSALKASQWIPVWVAFRDLVQWLALIQIPQRVQQYGKLPFTPSEEESILCVSKYGIKVASSDQFDILHRHPLYLIVRVICYDDGLGMGKSLLAIKTTDANQAEYSICVYQCNSLEQAQTICKVLSTAFDSALSSDKS